MAVIDTSSEEQQTAEAKHQARVTSMTGGMTRDIASDFVGSDRLRPDGRPRPELRTELRKIDNVRNSIAVIVALLAPVAAIGVVATLDIPFLWILFIPVMGALQNRMYILHHEAAHRLLFSKRTLNDRIGINLLGWLPFGTGTHSYRRGHANHHRDEFGPNEPDFLLYSFYPIARDSARRKLMRDAFGVSAYRIAKPRFVGLLNRKFMKYSLRYFAGQVLVFSLFWLAGEKMLYVLLWVLPYATYYQFVNRLRSVAEHGGMTRSPDRRHTTHHVRQTLLARTLFVPCGVGYHLAHHVDSGVPFRNLPRLHQILVEDGYFPEGSEWPTYRAFWRSCFSGQRRPRVAGS